jgi:hypothetical protein
MCNRFVALSGFALLIAGLVRADEKVTLREELLPGDTAVVVLSFRADGNLLIPQSEQKEKSQSFSAHARFEFEEKLLPQTDSGVDTAKSPTAIRSLRYYSVEEYELIDADAILDSLAIGGLLPNEPVAAGDSWRPASYAVAAAFNLTHIGNNQLQMKLDRLDESVANISLVGHVEGICSGTATLRSYSGQFVFDRQQKKIVQADVNHREERKAGPLGSALDVRASYQFRRNVSAQITQLNDEELKKIPTVSNPATELVMYSQPGRYSAVTREW